MVCLVTCARLKQTNKREREERERVRQEGEEQLKYEKETTINTNNKKLYNLFLYFLLFKQNGEVKSNS